MLRYLQGVTPDSAISLREPGLGHSADERVPSHVLVCFLTLVLGWVPQPRLVFQLAEVAVPRAVFQEVLERIGRLRLAPG